MVLAFLNITILDRYFAIFGSDLRASPPLRMFNYRVAPWETRAQLLAAKTFQYSQHKH